MVASINLSSRHPARRDGYLPLRDYAALGDGRSIALVGGDGAIDWWCVPDMHSPPLFDRLLDAKKGGHYVIEPSDAYRLERRYIRDSNVLETIFTTASGRARLVESINSGSAGRLPWCELARRVEGLEGTVAFKVRLRFGRATHAPACRMQDNANGRVFHVGSLLGLLICSGGVEKALLETSGFDASFTVRPGQREILAVVAGRDEPLVAPSINDIDQRIDLTSQEWRDWSDQVIFQGAARSELLRNALALKLLLYSPTGAIAAAPTTSLPEKLGGSRNYDYRYAWVRDAGYIIKAFLSLNQQAEAKAAFTWIVKCMTKHGPKVVYTLDGWPAPRVEELGLDGYRHSRPVRTGNDASGQWQHGVLGDIFEVARDFVRGGNIIDEQTAELLQSLADQAATCWREKDSGLWELSDERHYTVSKISCWQALDRAIFLVDQGHMPDGRRLHWLQQRNEIVAWIDEHCWSETKQAYTAWPGCTELDAAVVLGIRFGLPLKERLALSLATIDRELGIGSFHYRCSWSRGLEGCFLACSLWLILAKCTLGQKEAAREAFAAFQSALGSYCGILPEMIDPDSGEFLSNVPLGLTHLAMVQVISALADQDPTTSDGGAISTDFQN